jgi:hypothetical protein
VISISFARVTIIAALAVAIIFILGILYARAQMPKFDPSKPYEVCKPRNDGSCDWQPALPNKITTVPIRPVEPVPILHMILPPEQYDHDYDGDLTIKIVDTIEELRALCKLDAPQLVACSTHNSQSCLIVMVKDELMRQRGWTTGLLLRHERGHCNGWGADHAGERSLTMPTSHWVSSGQRVALPIATQPDLVMGGKPK